MPSDLGRCPLSGSLICEPVSTGVLGPQGRGLIAAEDVGGHPSLFCSIHTFGKALGSHGAAFVGPEIAKQYLVNYCFPFIYSTALPFHRWACFSQGAFRPKGADAPVLTSASSFPASQACIAR
jgi:hypothetical protein